MWDWERQSYVASAWPTHTGFCWWDVTDHTSTDEQLISVWPSVVEDNKQETDKVGLREENKHQWTRTPKSPKNDLVTAEVNFSTSTKSMQLVREAVDSRSSEVSLTQTADGPAYWA